MDAGRLYKNPALRVDRARAEEAIRALLRERLLDPARKTGRGPEVTIPVLWRDDLPRIAASLGARIVDEPELMAREERPTPHEAIVARAPGHLARHVPDKWELLGDVVVIRLDPMAAADERAIAEAFAGALDAKCVIADRGGVAGELREMRTEILVGDDPVSTTVENGIRYRADWSRIMFSSGNLHERTRAASIRAPGETIVDMFAGIGYFALPIAKHSGAARVIALEKNEISFRYLQENVALNDVGAIVEPWLGDNRDFPREGIADRVLMGYFPGTDRYLAKAMRILKPGGGIVHYHNTAHADHWRAELEAQLRSHAREVDVIEARVVKRHSPGIVHAVIVARVRRSP